MRCGILGDRTSDWVPKTQQEVDVTPADFDTLTQTFEKAGDTDSALAEWPIGTPNETFSNMYVTGVQANAVKGGLWEATISYTGIYPSGNLQTYYRGGEGTSVSKQLYKPPQTSVRTYTETNEERVAQTVYKNRVPRLTCNEKYVTSEVPDNRELGVKGRPFNPPNEIQLIENDWPWSFFFYKYEPNGWILLTRNWTQVLDKNLFTIEDEWEYQPPTEWTR